MLETLRLRQDEPVDEPAVTIDAFLEQTNAASVRIEAGDDVRRLVPVLDRVRLVEIDFPKFRDGRGFSSARMFPIRSQVIRVKASSSASLTPKSRPMMSLTSPPVQKARPVPVSSTARTESRVRSAAKVSRSSA